MFVLHRTHLKKLFIQYLITLVLFGEIKIKTGKIIKQIVIFKYIISLVINSSGDDNTSEFNFTLYYIIGLIKYTNKN
jgi:hypothetical protein